MVIAHVCHTPQDTCATSAPPSAALRIVKKKRSKSDYSRTKQHKLKIGICVNFPWDSQRHLHIPRLMTNYIYYY